MKRFKNLYPAVFEFQNLLKAARQAQRGKRFRPDVAQFNLNLERELLSLQQELKEKSYRHGGYRHFPVHEGKKRIISSAPYRDRVVHHALCNVIEPLIDRTFIHDSYACRKGKGTHAAVDRLTQFIRQNKYALKIDIRKYFPSIRQDVLLSILKRKIGDEDVLWLITEILNSHQESLPCDEKGNFLLDFEGAAGIPIGNLTSQFFANAYLNPFDHFVKEDLHCAAYIRYVDDFVLLNDSKQSLNAWREKIKTFLQKELDLSIHQERASVFPIEQGIDFLGYQVYRDHRLVRNGNGYRFLKRFKKMKTQCQKGEKTVREISQSVASWIGHVSHADSWRLRTALLQEAVL